MKPITKDVRTMVEEAVPNFVKAVNHPEADNIILTLDAFVDDPVLLYACLWYASSHGKSVIVAVSKN